MNIASGITQNLAVAVAQKPEDLSAFLQPDCAALVWSREPLDSFQTWVDDLDPKLLPHARVILRPEAARAIATEICGISGLPSCPERAVLVEDIAALARIFAELVNAPFLRLRLERVTTNACRKFHIDAVTARLVCTYRGTGTQYGVSTDGDDPWHVSTVATGAPILLRGTKWPGGHKSGLLHRSPPIKGTGETRLVLVLDPIQNAEEEA